MRLSSIKKSAKIDHSENYSLSEYDYQDFIYSVTLRKESAEAKVANIVFGADKELETYWLLSIDFENGQIVLGNQDVKEIKSVSFSFLDNTDYKINLIVNDGVAKIYVNNSDISLLVLGLDGYTTGKLGGDLANSNFVTSKESLTSFNTLSGDIFCSGYEVLKVVNLTDGNYRLEENEYYVEAGVINIAQPYLKTLENNYTYKFRATTTLTDLDFYVKTEDVGAQVISSVSKYYRGDDVRFELSENVKVKKAFIDKEEYAFTQNNEFVTIASSELTSLSSGDHTVKLFTENGRPEAKFSMNEIVEIVPEVTPPVSHTFFFIDIAIFAVLILGYIGYSQYKKHK